MKYFVCAIALIFAAAFSAEAQPSGNPVPVTTDNFARAESDTYFANIVKQAGGWENFSIAAKSNRSTTRSSSVPTATPFIRRRYSTSMPGR
jgi:hypothetical protein